MADSTAKARYRLTTNVGDVDGVADDFELEAGIAKAEVVGHATGLVNDPNPAIGSFNVVELEVSAASATDAETAVEAIIAAATAVGGVELVTDAAVSALDDGFTVTADATTLVASNDAPTQQEGGAEVVVTVTLTQKFTTAEPAITSDVATVYANGNGTVVFADVLNGTATITINTEAGDAAIDPFVFTVSATDASGVTVTEVVTLTVTAA